MKKPVENEYTVNNYYKLFIELKKSLFYFFIL